MEIVRISDFEDPKIEDFLASQEFLPIQQTPEWARFQKNLGVESLRFAVFDEAKIVAFAQVFVKKLPFGFTKVEVPRGPLWQLAVDRRQLTEISNLIFAEIRKYAQEQDVVFARFEFQKNMELRTQNSELKTAPEENFPLATIRIDLKKSEEEILKEMKSKGRYNIRVAEKHGVQVVQEKSVDDFFTLLQKTTARDGFAGHPKSYYEKMLESLGENCTLFVARQDSKPLAAIIVTFGGDTATYYFGASDHEFRHLMAPYLLQFEALKIAKERGCRFYDFLGVAPENSEKHHLAGVSNFKRKFGGEYTEYPRPRELVVRPFFYRGFKFLKKIRNR